MKPEQEKYKGLPINPETGLPFPSTLSRLKEEENRKARENERGKIFLPTPKQAPAGVMTALIEYSAGDATNIALLLDNIEDLPKYEIEFKIATGKDFDMLYYRLIALAKNKGAESIPKPESIGVFERHQIVLPCCGFRLHYSNLEAITTCLGCGKKHELPTLTPLLKKLLKENPDLKNNQSRIKSMWDLFTGMRGK